MSEQVGDGVQEPRRGRRRGGRSGKPSAEFVAEVVSAVVGGLEGLLAREFERGRLLGQAQAAASAVRGRRVMTVLGQPTDVLPKDGGGPPPAAGAAVVLTVNEAARDSARDSHYEALMHEARRRQGRRA